MNKLDLSGVTGVKGFPLRSTSFSFAINDVLLALSKAIGNGMIGESAVTDGIPVALTGLRQTGNIIEDGYVYNPNAFEFFFVEGDDITGYANIPVLIENFINDPTLDPTTMSDSTTANIHKVRYYKIADQLTGTGVVDYADLVFLNDQTVRTKVLDIGDWNMDSTATLNVPHGLTSTDIVSVDVWIREDSPGLSVLPLNYAQPGLMGFFSYDGTNIIMERNGGGVFDSTSYNATSYNRGYITIHYRS